MVTRHVVTWGTRAMLVDARDGGAAIETARRRLRQARELHGPHVVVPDVEDMAARAHDEHDDALFPGRVRRDELGRVVGRTARAVR